MSAEFGQRVMAAAGVAKVPNDLCAWCRDTRKMHECGGNCGVVGCSCESFVASYRYPDPLTPEGFVALWDALEARGWRVRISAHYAMPAYTCGLSSFTPEGFPDRSISLDRTTRAAALPSPPPQPSGWRCRVASKCQALDLNGKRCRREATHTLDYFGDGDLYGAASVPWGWPFVSIWVRVDLCKQHAGSRGRAKQKGGKRA